ncbi:hypothetical protein [Streptomyces pinistramenti]|uniref:hypothetical protein n=1 Tax=Streptomyces pinistramenti TaxID=2884812 RepID=UPI001D06FAA5|nr:hypothetical protein [Streptomyces pinistramenti]MCB5907792.1 hypothetical protein [Streptomyces pinistramenti]
MTTITVILLFLLGAAAPTAGAAVAAPATGFALMGAPAALGGPLYGNGELAERESERGQAVRRGSRHAYLPLPDSGPPLPSPSAAVLSVGNCAPAGARAQRASPRVSVPRELRVLHCVFRC